MGRSLFRYLGPLHASNPLVWIGIVLLISIFSIFFLGRNPQTGAFRLTLDGLSQFRLGMDIAGGVELMYKLDFSEYRSIYRDLASFQQIRQQTISIIQNTVENRVNALGVGDATVVVQTIDGDDYLVVSLGGMQDYEQAKEVIGKTVQLRFATPAQPNPAETERRRLLMSSLVNRTESVTELVTLASLPDAMVGTVTGVDLTRLPVIYSDNRDRIARMTIPGKIFLEGVYSVGLGSNNEIQMNSGFVLADISARESFQKETIRGSDVIAVLDRASIPWREESLQTSFTSTGVQYREGRIQFPLEQQFSGQDAQLVRAISISLSGITLSDEEKNRYLTLFLNRQTNQIKLPFDVIYSEVWESVPNLSLRFPGYNASLSGQYIQDGDTLFLINSLANNPATQPLWRVIVSDPVSQKQYTMLEQQMRQGRRLTLSEVFVPYNPLWETAVDSRTNEILDARFFQSAMVSVDQLGQPVVIINFNDKGREIFCNITERFVGQQVAIFVGDTTQPLTAPTINERICGGQAQISGGFDRQGAQKLAADLNEGAFPVPMILETENIINPTLGINALRSALLAGGIGSLILFVFFFLFYPVRFALVAGGTIIIYMIILLGMLKIFDYPFSLSGIAAILIALGMAVDANVLIFERLREQQGSITWSHITKAVNDSRSAIKDGNVSTGLIAFILAASGIALLQGFGTMLIITIIVTLAVNVSVCKALLGIMYHQGDQPT
ncbi:MAG: protein translocase subunit SecD [Candidatus Absconditabacterales bacterium]|nr:protein translocase subunit SecD [Candidatus Absconditabacterales bacterium]